VHFIQWVSGTDNVLLEVPSLNQINVANQHFYVEISRAPDPTNLGVR